jgi:hypothetical protein
MYVAKYTYRLEIVEPTIRGGSPTEAVHVPGIDTVNKYILVTSAQSSNALRVPRFPGETPNSTSASAL